MAALAMGYGAQKTGCNSFRNWQELPNLTLHLGRHRHHYTAIFMFVVRHSMGDNLTGGNSPLLTLLNIACSCSSLAENCVLETDKIQGEFATMQIGH